MVILRNAFKIVVKVSKDASSRDMPGMAAQIAYHLIFALMPMLIFLTAVAGFVAHRVGVTNSMIHITQWLTDHASPQIASVLQAPIAHALNTQPESLLTFGGLLTLWSARGAIASMMGGLNLAYGTKDSRSWFVRQGLAIALTIGLALAVVAGSVLNLLGTDAARRLADQLQMGQTWVRISRLVQWPATVAIVIVLVALLHFLAPDVHLGFGWILPGAILTVVLWIGAIYALRIYFKLARGFAEAYGVFGAMLAVIFWIYILGMILLIGGLFNAAIYAVLRPNEAAAAVQKPRSESRQAAA